MIPVDINLASVLPAVMLVATGILVMVADPFVQRAGKMQLLWVALAGVIAAAAALIPASVAAGTWYRGLWVVDDYSIFFQATFLLIAAMSILSSIEFVRRENLPPSEFGALLLFATTGAMLMAGAAELMLLFVGIEILSMATYVLAGYRREDLRSNEAALKYFLLGSFASAFFLYGVAMVFGATGSTRLATIAASLDGGGVRMDLVYLGSGLILVGLAFKVALAPFHVWTPDVYEGAPTPVTAFMSVGPKAAGFAVLLRIFMTAFPGIQDRWIWIIWAAAAMTMLIGNIVAVAQPGIKRMLAYSSIAHAGYVAVAVASGTSRGATAALFYLLAYSATNLGAFAIVAAVSRKGDTRVALEDYRGLAWKKPGLAAAFTLFLLSLAGIPATAGFAGKFFIFGAAVESGLTGLVIIGVLTTVVSFYYYLYVVIQMYMYEAAGSFEDVRVPPATKLVVLSAVALTLYMGILPFRTLEWAGAAAAALIGFPPGG